MKGEGIEVRRVLSLKEIVFGLLRFLPRLPAFCVHGFRLVALARKRQVSFLDLFERTVRKYPNRPAVTCDRQTLTYRDLNIRANRVSRAIFSEGIGPGDTVCVLLEGGTDIITLFLALMKLGATAALISPRLRGPSLIQALSICHCTGIVLSPSCIDAYSEIASNLETPRLRAVLPSTGETAPVGFFDIRTAAENASSDSLPRPELSESRPISLLFTSGTTGDPKAVPVFHRRLVMSAVWYGRLLLGLRTSDVIYCPLPLYHAAGIAMGWPGAVIAGASLAVPRRFSASGLLTDLNSTGATVLLYIGELLTYAMKALRDSPIGGLRLRALLGTGLRLHLWPKVRAEFGNPRIVETYASTEAVGVFANLLDLNGTVGISFDPHLFARVDADTGEPIRNCEGRFERAGRGETGRLFFRARGDKPSTTDEDVWFDTGDLLLNLGFGHAAFVDRTGDTYRWKGEIISSRDVESALLSAPQVRDASVFGIAIPNTDGRAGAAAISTDVSPSRFNIDTLASHLYQTLPDYAVPVFLFLSADLKNTDTFKNSAVHRPDLRGILSVANSTLFVRLPGTSSFVPMNDRLASEIEQGIIF